MLRLTILKPDGQPVICSVEQGTTVLEAAHENGLERYLEGTCGQCMACATCHVHVTGDWYDRLPEPSEEEEEMLDLAFFVGATSRLGCQIVMSPALDGLVVQVPPGKGD
jgi:2Fe-2S ferredoxin